MSREVDERVVEMQFDNKQFETGVAQTIKSLDKLNETLKFEGLGNSVRGIQNSISKLDFTPISNGVSALESSLTSLTGRIKMEVFDRLANMAVDTGEKILKAMTIGGAQAGMAEYETQMGAVQTILANTQHLGTTITDVNKALDDLNEYADLTIYNFTEMTRNIGTFTAAGLDLETSTSAIKGIANLAAVSGSTSEQASRAMYQLSQALAAGRVNLQDWNSVVNAGMGGKVFQDALKRTAKHMGVVVDESKNFRETISGSTTWLTADILSETLKQFSGDLDEATLREQGWSDQEIKDITKMAATATDAATVVKTMKQLLDTVNEQIGSGWTKTWQLIFGDFEESKQLWTSIYKAISPYIDAISDLRNGYLQFWRENEGRDKVLQAFSNIWSGISSVITDFTSKFRIAFPVVNNFGQVLVDISEKFLEFSERFKSVTDRVKSVTTAFNDVSDAISNITAEDKKNALDIWNWGNINGNPGRIDGQARVEALGESYDRVQKYIDTFIATGYDVAKTDELLGVGAQTANEAISETAEINTMAASVETKRYLILQNLVEILRNLADVAKVIGGSLLKTAKAAGEAFKDVFDPLMATGDLEKSTNVLSKIAKAFEITAEKAEDVKRIFRGVFAAFDILYQLVRSVAGAIARALLPSLDAVDSAGGGLLNVLGDFGDWVYAIDQAIKEGDLFSLAIDSMIGFVSSLGDKIRDAVHAFEEWSGIDFGKVTSSIASAITKGLNKFKEWTGIDIAAIFKSIWENIKTFVGYLKAGDFSGAFDYVADGIKGFASTVVEAIKNLDFKEILGKVGEIFGDIGTWIRDTFDKAFGGTKDASGKAVDSAKESFSLLDILGAIIYGGYTVIKKAIDFLYGIFTSDTAKNLGTSIKEFFTGLFDNTSADGGAEKSGMEKFAEFMSKLGKALADFYEQVKPIIGAGFIGGFLKIFSDFSSATTNFSEAPLVLTEAFNSISDSFDNFSKAAKTESVTRFVKELANSLLKLAIAIAIIMVLEKMEGGVAGATTVITIMLGEIIGALTFAQKKLDSELNMALMAAMIKQIGNTMLVLALALLVISKAGDSSAIVSSLIAFSAIMVKLAAFMFVASEIVKSKQFRRGGEGMAMIMALMTQIGKTMIVMAIALNIMSKVDPERMPATLEGMIMSMGAIATLIFIVAELTKKLGEGKVDELAAFGGLFMSIAGAFLMLAPFIMVLGSLEKENLDAAIDALLKIAVIFAVVAIAAESASKGGTNSKAITAAGAGMIMLALALDILMPALVSLASLDGDALIKGITALAIVMAIMGLTLAGVATVGGGVAAAAFGLLALAAAVAIITPALMMFAAAAYPVIKKVIEKVEETDDKKLSDIAKKILKLSGALAVAGLALVIFGAGLAVLGLALVIIGAATLIMTPFAAALSGLIVAFMAASKAWPSMKKMLTELGPALGESFVSFLETIINGAGKIADALKKVAPKIKESIVIVLETMLAAIWEWIPGATQSFLQMLSLMLDALLEYMPALLEKLGALIVIILEWVDNNIEYWTELVVSILLGVLVGAINGLTDRVDEIVDAIFDFLIALFNAVANAIKEKGDDLLESIAGVIYEIFALIGRGLKRYWYMMEDYGGDIIEKVVNGLSAKLKSITNWFKTLIKEDIPNALSEVWSNIEQIGKDLCNAIVEGLKGQWEEGKETVKAWANDLLGILGIEWQIESPSKATAELGEYLGKGVAVGIKKSEKSAADAAKVLGDDVYDELDNSLNGKDLEDPDYDITSKFHIDTTELDSFNIDDFFADNDISTVFGSGIDVSSLLADATASTEEQRHADTEANNSMMSKLTDSMSGLADKLNASNIISVPDDATFSIPVSIDGQQVAYASAPYLDTINANNYNLNRKGVTSR